MRAESYSSVFHLEESANEICGDDAVWLRDSVHVAHAIWRTGDPQGAARILEQLLAFQHATLARFDAVIEVGPIRAIPSNVREKELEGPYGIRRYDGDS